MLVPAPRIAMHSGFGFCRRVTGGNVEPQYDMTMSECVVVDREPRLTQTTSTQELPPRYNW